MFEIAGGILLAVAILYFLPLIIAFAVTAVGAATIIGIAGVIVYFTFTEFQSVLVLVGVLFGAVFFFTILASLLGIVVSRLPILKKRYINKVSLIKPIDLKLDKFLSDVYNYYQPIGINAYWVLLIFSIVMFFLLTIYVAYLR
jgi:hypothetical protein